MQEQPEPIDTPAENRDGLAAVAILAVSIGFIILVAVALL
ncbi:MAG: hypothetical protein ACI9TF_001785 [Paracrocinitomix sp.]|jgi:hypothetical protein|tara:strand:+ start:334 stop:453 length:120 start_codon:yes stop_codon:yes gene_type:complete